MLTSRVPGARSLVTAQESTKAPSSARVSARRLFPRRWPSSQAYRRRMRSSSCSTSVSPPPTWATRRWPTTSNASLCGPTPPARTRPAAHDKRSSRNLRTPKQRGGGQCDLALGAEIATERLGSLCGFSPQEVTACRGVRSRGRTCTPAPY